MDTFRGKRGVFLFSQDRQDIARHLSPNGDRGIHWYQRRDAANTEKGSTSPEVQTIAMDRNYRYPRRGGCSHNAPHMGQHTPIQPRQGGWDARETAPSENCLCDKQPISLAMSYVKVQPFGSLYELCDGWKNGTLFPCLYMPYCIGGRK